MSRKNDVSLARVRAAGLPLPTLAKATVELRRTDDGTLHPASCPTGRGGTPVTIAFAELEAADADRTCTHLGYGRCRLSSGMAAADRAYVQAAAAHLLHLIDSRDRLAAGKLPGAIILRARAELESELGRIPQTRLDPADEAAVAAYRDETDRLLEEQLSLLPGADRTERLASLLDWLARMVDAIVDDGPTEEPTWSALTPHERVTVVAVETAAALLRAASEPAVSGDAATRWILDDEQDRALRVRLSAKKVPLGRALDGWGQQAVAAAAKVLPRRICVPDRDAEADREQPAGRGERYVAVTTSVSLDVGAPDMAGLAVAVLALTATGYVHPSGAVRRDAGHSARAAFVTAPALVVDAAARAVDRVTLPGRYDDCASVRDLGPVDATVTEDVLETTARLWRIQPGERGVPVGTWRGRPWQTSPPPEPLADPAAALTVARAIHT